MKSATRTAPQARPRQGKAPAAAVPDEAREDQSSARSLRRALGILELIMQRDQAITVIDMVDGLKIPKSTAYELVKTLSAEGYLERVGQGGDYFLGRKLFELGMAYRSQRDLPREGSQVVEELRNETGETVQLSVLENDLMVVLLKEDGTHPIRIISRVGSRVPINWAAAGRLLVSDMNDTELRALIQRSARPSPTGRAATDPDTLIAQIRKVRSQGYATELNETNEHAGCVAAPVIDGSGKVLAALSVVVPEQRLARPNRERLVSAVRAAAGKLSRGFGGPKP